MGNVRDIKACLGSPLGCIGFVARKTLLVDYLTAADAAWAEFRVWQDADQDGVTDVGELKTLDQKGFTEIGLTCDDSSSYAQIDDDVIIEGAALHGAAKHARPESLDNLIVELLLRKSWPFGDSTKMASV